MFTQETAINEWEEAWAEYIFALQMWDSLSCGEDFVYWAGIAGRRLKEAKHRLYSIDREFCESIGVYERSSLGKAAKL